MAARMTTRSIRLVLTACAAAAVAAFAHLSPIAVTAAGQAPRDGWVSLFNGTSLDGWRGYKRTDAVGTRWSAVDGMLCLNNGLDTRSARDIVSMNLYEEFELTWEWRVAEGGNSGVKYFVLEDTDSAIGHEYQVIDDERHPDAKFGPKRQTAALYDVIGATNRPTRPAGQFNQSRIVVSGQRVEHWLNGAQVLQYDLASAALARDVAASKFKDVARFGKRQTGHLLLQDHGDAVCYRNIMVRRGPNAAR